MYLGFLNIEECFVRRELLFDMKVFVCLCWFEVCGNVVLMYIL